MNWRENRAQIIYGERANTEFPTLKVKDGDKYNIGKIELTFMETPGHTPEGITILAKNTEADDEPVKMFTGDTLFIGDVGRPDLIGSKGFSAEEMGSMLYDSIHNKILPLPDETEVYPAHGAGSLCGKSLSKETWSTLGEQRKFNYALKPMSRESSSRSCQRSAGSTGVFPDQCGPNLKGSVAIEDLPKPEVLSSEQIANFDGIVIDVGRMSVGSGHVANAITLALADSSRLGGHDDSHRYADRDRRGYGSRSMRIHATARVGMTGQRICSDVRIFCRKVIEQVPFAEVHHCWKPRARSSWMCDGRRVRKWPRGRNGKHPARTGFQERYINSTRLCHLRDLPERISVESGCKLLENAGFANVYNVTGGTAAWTEAGLPVEAEQTACQAGS